MKISFKEYNDGCKSEISCNNDVVGHAERTFLGQAWKVVPYFHLNVTFFNQVGETWDSCYLAGKALARMYEDEMQHKEEVSHWTEDDQPIDVRDMWNNYRIKP